MVDTPLLSKASNGHTLATPPPPPPRQLPQTLRCSSLSNNYATTRSGMANSYSMASSSIVSQQWKGQNHDHLRGQNTDKVVRQAQTQTETKMSCFRQFIFCLLANEVNYIQHSVEIRFFLSLRFYVKSDFGEFISSKIDIFATLGALNFVDLANFSIQ